MKTINSAMIHTQKTDVLLVLQIQPIRTSLTRAMLMNNYQASAKKLTVILKSDVFQRVSTTRIQNIDTYD